MNVRDFRPGDELALHAVFHSAVHRVACHDYTDEQINAWAPELVDRPGWIALMQRIRPFVVEDGRGGVLGYADLQSTGYIDHFYVSGHCVRQGVGSLLMNRIHEAAQARGITSLTADVSRTAQPFFSRFGFVLVQERVPVVRGVVVPNARMHKQLA